MVPRVKRRGEMCNGTSVFTAGEYTSNGVNFIRSISHDENTKMREVKVATQDWNPGLKSNKTKKKNKQ